MQPPWQGERLLGRRTGRETRLRGERTACTYFSRMAGIFTVPVLILLSEAQHFLLQAKMNADHGQLQKGECCLLTFLIGSLDHAAPRHPAYDFNYAPPFVSLFAIKKKREERGKKKTFSTWNKRAGQEARKYWHSIFDSAAIHGYWNNRGERRHGGWNVLVSFHFFSTFLLFFLFFFFIFSVLFFFLSSFPSFFTNFVSFEGANV